MTTPRPRLAMTLAGVLIVYCLVNVLRAVADPAGFAAYYGIPLQAPDEVNFVFVYAIRTAFLAAAAGALLATRNFAALAWFCAAAVLMPIGDLFLVIREGAGGGTIARHVFAGMLLAVTAWQLTRVARGPAPNPA